jgi:hypothetical protein
VRIATWALTSSAGNLGCVASLYLSKFVRPKLFEIVIEVSIDLQINIFGMILTLFGDFGLPDNDTCKIQIKSGRRSVLPILTGCFGKGQRPELAGD